MKRMLKYKHTDAFYKKQYIKYNNQVDINVFNNFDTFKSAYIAAEKEGMSSLRTSAAKYVKEGVTSIAEMLKVTYSADEE